MGSVPNNIWIKLGFMIALYYGGKEVKKYLKYGLLAYLGYQIYLYRTGAIQSADGLSGPLDRMKIHFDTDMALDMFMPDMTPHGRQITKVAVNHLLKGLNS